MAGRWSLLRSFAFGLGLSGVLGVAIGIAAAGINADEDTTDARNRLELFVPAENAWKKAGRLPEPRESPTLLSLGDGRVLIAGGTSYGEDQHGEAYVWNAKTSDAELVGRAPEGKCTALVRLGGARVAVLAGSISAQVEGSVLDVGSRQWKSIAFHGDSLMTGAAADGDSVLIVGQRSAWLWNSATDQASPVPVPLAPGGKPAMTECLFSARLADGRVLFVNQRWYDPQWNAFAYVWTPGAGTLASGSSLGDGLLDEKNNTAITIGAFARKHGGVAIVLRDRVLLAGADLGTTTRVDLPADYEGVTMLADEALLLTRSDSDPPEAIVFNPATKEGRATRPLLDSRYNYTQIALEDGRVLIAGGSERGKRTSPRWIALALASAIVAGVWKAVRWGLARGASRRGVVAGLVAVVALAGLFALWVASWGSFIKG